LNRNLYSKNLTTGNTRIQSIIENNNGTTNGFNTYIVKTNNIKKRKLEVLKVILFFEAILNFLG
jgi:hypothetical protein